MTYGFRQVLERADYASYFDSNFSVLIDDEAIDMSFNSIRLSRCIKRPTDIGVSAHAPGIDYDIQFSKGEPHGSYWISGGKFRGHGQVVEVREADTPSFLHYFYLKLSSVTTHLFVCRIAISGFSKIVPPEELPD